MTIGGIKRVVTKVPSPPAAAQADAAHWLSRPMAERVAAVELLRLQMHGYLDDPDAQPRLQRVHRVARREPR